MNVENIGFLTLILNVEYLSQRDRGIEILPRRGDNVTARLGAKHPVTAARYCAPGFEGTIQLSLPWPSVTLG